jgi:hypothetical protein
MKPLHLWDYTTKSLISDSYKSFTSMIEIQISGVREVSYIAFKLDVRLILIFEIQAENSIIPSLKPWAGIYLLKYGNETSRAILDVISKEETHEFAYVAREARKIVLSQTSNGPMLPATWKFNPTWDDAYVSLEVVPNFDDPPIEINFVQRN